MSDFPENIKFWNFLKFLLVYIIPVIVSACLVALIYKAVATMGLIFCIVFVIISFPIYIYCVIIKYLLKMINNDKIMVWIEKPWNGPTISFKK